MILVFAPKSTARLRYTLNLMLRELLGFDFTITTDTDEFQSYSGAKFSYGKRLQDNDLHFASTDLLFKTGIHNLDLLSKDYNGNKVLFPVNKHDAALPYDPFAAVFFMVSRYEEYLHYRKDKFGRFTAMESIAYKFGFLHKPVVNIWTVEVGKTLENHFNGLKTKTRLYRFLPTYDIDQAWSYKNKGFLRVTRALAKSAIKGDFSNVIERIRVITGFRKDPFDTLEYQLHLQMKYHLQPIYFFLFGKYGEYDKNIATSNTHYRNLIKYIADYSDTGIHPSYSSNSSNKILGKEIKELSKLLNREIHHSRQHYLKLHLPDTYRNLANFGISKDYTMGFAALPGFRAGICTPYQFYDIDMETVIPVTVIPFAVMDGTLKDYMKLSPDKAIDTINDLISEVKAVNGVFSSLWHNESLSETDRWLGWLRVYESLIENAVP